VTRRGPARRGRTWRGKVGIPSAKGVSLLNFSVQAARLGQAGHGFARHGAVEILGASRVSP
jgi:hypothetical protein